MDILNINPNVLLLQAVSFLLVLWVFWKFLFGPIRDLLDSRKNEVESEFSGAEKQRKEADELKTQYQERLANVEEEVRTKIAAAVKDGQSMRDEILSDTHAKADGILEKANAEIAREKESAMAELKTTVANLSITAAGKIISEDLNDAKHHELIAQFINDLDGVSK